MSTTEDRKALAEECKRLAVELFRDTQRLTGAINDAEALIAAIDGWAPVGGHPESGQQGRMQAAEAPEQDGKEGGQA
jgi:hypothetical protein